MPRDEAQIGPGVNKPLAEGNKGRVLIRTLLRPWWLNYGGMLQAWALQQVLNDLGYFSAVDTSRSDISTLKLDSRYLAMNLAMRILPAQLVPRRFHRKIALQASEALAMNFSRNNIVTVRLYSWRRQPRSRVVGRYDAFIVGSDQVWRPGMADVPSYLMDFLSDRDSRERIAYAASFGSDNPAGYDESMIQYTRPLANRMTAISVREKSGVDLCASFWGVEAVRLPDPTLLLRKERYLALAFSDVSNDRPGDDLVSYILDPTIDTDQIVKRAAAVIGRDPSILLPSVPDSISEFRANRKKYMRPTTEKWLQAFANSRYVITDSFHGCVFSIIFERPFLVIPNHARGFTRFDSLLDVYGLRNRMVGSVNEVDRLFEPIDWNKVKSVLEAERERGLIFLSSALNSAEHKSTTIGQNAPKRLRGSI
ncbi:polysaccharide pyruvyl transferase family protein [Mycolicibacterium austroafricanum]|uniref:polysaccharide pyruvyl transferase family protein n=1 Tax=Mycolicibacterium austroafricanum TaxID=39687 RepID=UPI001CA32D37|nr:polysaccharide pyruvyl transferase family protein [Mycolicibacterium austroafricanum]QZT63660.1 polysaccharide pyruvyl transferase family protein [Mycolicibacterium austroafricanum]